MERILNEEIEAAWFGERRIEAALAAADRRTNDLLKR